MIILLGLIEIDDKQMIDLRHIPTRMNPSRGSIINA